MIKKITQNKFLHQEILYFLSIGLFTTSIDFILYSIGQHFVSYSIAKACSFMLATCFSYLLHKHFTFRQKQHKIKNMFRFAILYFLSMGLNVLMNSLSIALLSACIFISWLTHREILISAFLIATGFSTIVNFLGQKFWVFRNSEPLEPIEFR